MSELCKQITLLGKGIGNENRFTILQIIMKKPQTVSEIARISCLPQPAVSQDLKVLKSANLVESSRNGQEISYSVNAEFMITLLKKLTNNLK